MATWRNFQAQPAKITITDSTTISAAVDLGKRMLVALQTPVALTGVAFTFQSSFDGTTYAPVTKEDGSAYTVTVAASKFCKIDYTVFLGCRYIKVVSGSAEAADRIIQLMTRELG